MRKAIAALVGLLAAAGGTLAEAETLRVAVAQRGFWNSTFVELARRQGYFKEAGLEIEILYTDGGAATLAPVIAGSVDVAMSNGILGVVAAYAKNLPVRIITAEATGAADAFWYARADKGIASLKDTSGKTVAFSSPGSSTNLILLSLVKASGASPRLVPTGGAPATYTQVMTGQVDVGWSVPPFVLKDIQEKRIAIVARGSDSAEVQGQTIRVNVANAKALAERREPDGLRCRYHGWKFATDGTLLEIPGEPDEKRIRSRVKQPAFPVIEQAGIIFTYLGSEPVPLLPQYDFLLAEGERRIQIGGFSRSNWLQCVENGMDPTHVTFTHGDVLTDLGAIPDRVEFEETDQGFVHKTFRPGPRKGTAFFREQHLFMPGIVVSGAGKRLIEGGDATTYGLMVRWTVPIDDEESMMVNIIFKPAECPGRLIKDMNPALFGRWEALKVEPFKEYRGDKPQPLGYRIPVSIPIQDATLLDSMGPIADRQNEFLAFGDEAIVRMRRMYLNAIDTAEQGCDPPAVFRKPGLFRVPANERMVEVA